MQDLINILSGEMGHQPWQVRNTLDLLGQDNTIPFIARYRKEATGGLDEVELRDLRERAKYLRELNERRDAVLLSISEQGKLDDALRGKINAAVTKQEIEDLYLPYKPKRRTRAAMAREKGLEPLRHALFDAPLDDGEFRARLQAFVEAGQEGAETPLDAEGALAGCRDILAEEVADDATTREWIRSRTRDQGTLQSTATREFATKKTKFSDYYEFEEPLGKIPAHRYLALRRGETEKVLRLQLAAPVEDIMQRMLGQWRGERRGEQGAQMELALEDAYRRLLAPAIEVELRVELKERADRESVALFSSNLESLLLQPPGGQKPVLGLDPGFRTGSKWAVVDDTGQMLAHGTIYPLPPQNQSGEASRALKTAIEKYRARVVAIGNGTASRELLQFTRGVVRDMGKAGQGVQVLMVNEAGASVYSASDIGREEFPDLDLTFRGAVSIARRYQDPLAELVKIDPKSIGVGQYQHDVNQGLLKQSLEDTVESCVNRVGVNLNTASWPLLSRVSGLGPSLAREIVNFRNTHGAFANRDALHEVPRMGPLSFQQSAGFLRIPGAAQPLDASAVHPEHYGVVENMAARLGIAVGELAGNPEQAKRIVAEEHVTPEVGRPTIDDILAELAKPGRDPRGEGSGVEFNEAVTEIEHLRPGMKLRGVVTNLTHFGAFVDIGVHQDGLVHVSQLSDRFVKDVTDVVRVGQGVEVTVLQVDAELKRIALSMKSAPDLEGARRRGRNGKGEQGA